MTASEFTVFLVDDEPEVLQALSRLLRIRGYNIQSYTSAREFLAAHDPATPGCAVLDFSMPDLDGLDLQQALTAAQPQRSVIFLTGHGDISTSVRAMKAGAVDFLTKPVSDTDLLAAIANAEKQDKEERDAFSVAASIDAKISTLTPREREVLPHVLGGRLTKQIAGDLGTVEKTIKVHRSRIFKKMGVRSVADLVRMAEKVGIHAIS